MPRVEVETHIARPPEDVHAYLRDFSRYPEWITFTKEVTRVEGDGSPGTRYWERGTGGTSSWQVVELEDGKREVHTGDIGVATVRIEMTMAPGAGGGTDYRHVIEYQPKLPVVGALLDKLVLGRQMRKGTRQTVTNLKEMLEAQAAD